MGVYAMLHAGDVLAGRYRLERRVGGGGMGDVWRGEDTLLNRTVAVKVLLAALAAEDGFRERFRREACAIAALESPHVVNVYDYGEVSSPRGVLAFLVMPYIDAPPLSRLLARVGRLEAPETLDIIAQVADGLHAAHRAGIIHRDIKPGNILVGDDGHVRLVDFGIARTSGNLTMTTTGVVLGTVTYMSPEQASGERLTPASDVYSLGVVGYQCLVGNPPFKADTPLEVLSAHLRDVPPRLPEEIPAPVPDLIVRALDKDPTQRWTDAGEFAAACRGAASAMRPQATAIATGPTEPVVRRPRFQPGPAADAGTAMAAADPVAPPARRGLMLLSVVALIAVLLATAAAMRSWEVRRLVEHTDQDRMSTHASVATNTSGPGDTAPQGEPVHTDSPSPQRSPTSPDGSPDGTTESSQSPSQSSSPPGSESVPDVVHLTEEQARDALDAAGFETIVDYEGEGTNTCNVVAQRPEAGRQADPGTAVTITVSRGEMCAGG